MKRYVFDTRQLLAFVTLSRRSSFTLAAQDLHLTQSAVSHAIKALEGDAGTRLFDRIGKRVQLTQAGEQLFRHAERVLREMQQARNGLEELQNWGHGRLRVGASTTACQHILPTVLREFKQSFPRCVIRIEPGDQARQMELLRTNQIDLALTLQPEDRGGEFEFRWLFEDELRFLVSPMHRWARKRQPPPAEIAEETIVLYNKNSSTFQQIDGYFRTAKVTLSNVIELGSMEAIKELVKIGVGVGVLAPWVARAELETGSLISLALGSRKLRRTWGVLYLRGRRLPLAEETFAGLCESVTESLTPEGRSLRERETLRSNSRSATDDRR